MLVSVGGGSCSAEDVCAVLCVLCSAEQQC